VAAEDFAAEFIDLATELAMSRRRRSSISERMMAPTPTSTAATMSVV
jgi:hypothetical protein